MGADSRHFTVLQYNDLICMLDGGSPLRHDKHRCLTGQLFQRPAKRRVRGVVKRRCAVIQNQNFRLRHKRPRYGKPLPLATGKIASFLCHGSVQPSLFRLHKLFCLRKPQRLPQLFIRGVSLSPQQIVPDRSSEKHRLLQNNADFFPQLLHSVKLHVPAVHTHRACGCVIKPWNHIHQGRFAGASAAYDAHSLALWHLYMDIAQGFRASPAVRQMYMIELHGQIPLRLLPALISLPRVRAGSLAASCCQTALAVRTGSRLLPPHGGLHLENRLNPIGAGQRLGNRNNQICQFNQLHENLRHVVDKSHHLALGNAAVVHAHRARIEQKYGSRIDDNISDWIGQCGDSSDDELQMCEKTVFLLKPPGLLFLLVERADYARTRQVFPRCGEHRIQPGLHLFVHGHG